MIKIRWVTIIMILAVFLAGNTNAEWIDDWINQKTYIGPNHYEASSRGYGTLGSVSARWNTSSDYLMGVTYPKYQHGCGGIDLFLGGYHFMKFDHLVKKMQQIMGPAAAAFAFDIALSVLSEQASSSIKSLEAIIDRLNQLQFDDCESQKTLTAIMKAGWDPDKYGKEATEAVQEYSIYKGMVDVYKEINDWGDNKTPKEAAASAGASLPQMINGCPQDLKDIYFSNGYVLDHLIDKKGVPYTSDYAALLRGLIGDVYLVVNATDIEPRLENPCARNPDFHVITLDHFINGDIEKRNAAGVCQSLDNLSLAGNVYSSLRDYVQQTLTAIGDKILSRAALTMVEEAFLMEIPAPVHQALTAMIGLQGAAADTTEIAAQFTDYVAAHQVYFMLNDFATHMAKAIDLGRKTYDEKRGTDSGSNQEDCQRKLAEGTRQQLEVLRKNLETIVDRLGRDFATKQVVLANNLQINKDMMEKVRELRGATLSRVAGNANRKNDKKGM